MTTDRLHDSGVNHFVAWELVDEGRQFGLLRSGILIVVLPSNK